MDDSLDDLFSEDVAPLPPQIPEIPGLTRRLEELSRTGCAQCVCGGFVRTNSDFILERSHGPELAVLQASATEARAYSFITYAVVRTMGAGRLVPKPSSKRWTCCIKASRSHTYLGA